MNKPQEYVIITIGYQEYMPPKPVGIKLFESLCSADIYGLHSVNIDGKYTKRAEMLGYSSYPSMHAVNPVDTLIFLENQNKYLEQEEQKRVEKAKAM